MENRVKMSPEERAKQFMPFAALKGYEEALARKEKPKVCRVEISEDVKEELDRNLQQLKINDMVELIYYNKNEYQKKTGVVSDIDVTGRYIKVVNTRIEFMNIYSINIIKQGE